MLAVTPSKSCEVALIANPEFEAGRVAGHRARRLIGGANIDLARPEVRSVRPHVAQTHFADAAYGGKERTS
jgi:hypothetical protein